MNKSKIPCVPISETHGGEEALQSRGLGGIEVLQ